MNDPLDDDFNELDIEESLSYDLPEKELEMPFTAQEQKQIDQLENFFNNAANQQF